MIVLINPNSTSSMTDAMVRTAQHAEPDVHIEGWTSAAGPPAIQGVADGLLAAEPLLTLVKKASDVGADAIIIGCFDDTALSEARRISACPVIGIGQAGYHMAVLAGSRFSVVTTLDVSVPILETNIQTYGFERFLSRVRASQVPVLELERNPDAAADRVITEVIAAARDDQIQSVVLGCGGMVDLVTRAAAASGLRVIDGVRSAAIMASAMVQPRGDG